VQEGCWASHCVSMHKIGVSGLEAIRGKGRDKHPHTQHTSSSPPFSLRCLTWRAMRGVGGMKAEERLMMTAATRAKRAKETRIFDW